MRPLILQDNQGTAGGLGTNPIPFTVSLPAGTSAGSTVVVHLHKTIALSPNPPSGWETLLAGPATAIHQWLRRVNVAADESSWEFSLTLAGAVSWHAWEVGGLDPDAPLDASSAPAGLSGTQTSLSTGSTGDNPSVDTLALAAHSFHRDPIGQTVSFSAHTNGFVEDAEQTAVDVSGTHLVTSWSSRVALGQVGPFETTATITNSGPAAGDIYHRSMVVLRGADSALYAPLSHFTGFEHGPAAGLTTGPAPPLAATTGSPTVVATVPRTGTYALECSATAAAENVLLADGAGAKVNRIPLYFPAALPAGDVELAFVETASSDLVLRYRSGSQKLGVQVGAGTEVLSDATVAADTWIVVDLAFDTTAATYLADWQVDYADAGLPVTQAQASGSGTAGSAVTGVRLGWVTAATATVRYDDVAGSAWLIVYPLPDINVELLTVDPAGTPTVSGSTANFGVMTGNATIAAWNATNARNAVDEVPPTIGASADGAVAVNASATDYAEFPMATYTQGTLDRVRAVKVMFVLWAASGTAATIRLLAATGSTVATLYAEADPNADNAAATWVCKPFIPPGGWDQAKLDALTVRFGSNDATPDIGLHAVYASVAAMTARRVRLANLEGGLFTLEAMMDPTTSAVIQLIGTSNDPARGTTMRWTLSGTPDLVYVAPDTSHTETLNAPTYEAVSSAGLEPDPAV